MKHKQIFAYSHTHGIGNDLSSSINFNIAGHDTPSAIKSPEYNRIVNSVGSLNERDLYCG